MKRSVLIELILLFSDYRFAVHSKSQRRSFLMQFSTPDLQRMYNSKIKTLMKLIKKYADD